MNLDLVKIVNKHVPDGQTFVFADGVAHIFWEGVLFQYKCNADLKNGIYDRNLKLIETIGRFEFQDLLDGKLSRIGFARLKDFCKVSTSGPEMFLCVDGTHEGEAGLHLCSKQLAQFIPGRYHQFSAEIVSRYLGLLKKNDETATADIRANEDGGVILVTVGEHKIYFLTRQILEKFRSAVSKYTAEVVRETGEDNKLYSYAQQPLALEV